MDRIVVHANPTHSKSTSLSISGVPGFLGILLATTYAYSSATTLVIGMAVLACFISVIWYFIRSRRARFQEAVVEITPLGVQLLSIYTTSRKADTSTKSKYDTDHVKIRAFLPKQQIIDVIVMEIVWPHCVWSQVAFRVAKSSKLKHRNEMSKQPCCTKSHNIHDLLQQNRVEIIPCFPDECRGMLMYEKCLDIQIKIEELLGLDKQRIAG